jgi:hypothetical protein
MNYLRPTLVAMVVLGLVACQGDQVPTSPDDSGIRIAAAKGGVKGKPDRSRTSDSDTSGDTVVSPDDPTVSDATSSPDGSADVVATDLEEQLKAELARLAAKEDAMRVQYKELNSATWAEFYKGSLISCWPQPYYYDAAIIGPEGGTLGAGHHSFSVPAGALSEAVVISMEAPPSNFVEVAMQPTGLSFQSSATMTLSYHWCDRDVVESLLIAYIDEFGNVIYRVPSKDDMHGKKVYGAIDHFSRYAIAR